ncbi:tobamovirus multiplication protein 1-like isoform X6 [Durio zibethinus]|uniref:Tobamovirus multiplication protein 1-like isoform X6 n=1 Tax=Durio zibethinus TaxID=66656 RepID=A0A6P6A2W8_DURZI|nr:tobamovirus multiplication protein 1-like isoform X6 [Durio zibethinus]
MVKCYPLNFLFVNIALACLDALLAFIAFFQLFRIHLQNQQVGWTRQKVLHLLIGSSSCGYFIYFLCMVVATCQRWLCWSNVCGFVLMAFPKILFLAAFLLLLSFWQMMKRMVMKKMVVSRFCWKVQRTRQVYIDFSATTVLIIGGAFGCYGFLLFSKLRRVRSEKASSEMWKVVGLAVVSVLCFISSSLIALLTDIPLFHHWNLKKINGVKALVLLILHYVIGSSVPFAFVLWFMRELPAPSTTNRQVQPRAITFISYGAAGMHHPQYGATATSSKNQVSRASPI